MGIFDKKNFNAEVFGKYLETVPRVKQNAFLTAGILRSRSDLQTLMTDQSGGNYVQVPMTGRIGGTPDNYDGSTNITADVLTTFLQGMVVVGRAHSWVERDFTFDISKKDFMADIAQQVATYWDDVDQSVILSELKGIFGVTDDGFTTKHTYDITSSSTPTIGNTTLNTAIQKACGDNRKLFSLVIVHSAIATNLENLQLLEHWEYLKDRRPNGIANDLTLATWNGKLLLIDDDVPVDTVGTSAGVYNIKVDTKAISGDKIKVNNVELIAGTDFSLTTDTATGNASAIATALNSSQDASVSCYTWTSNSTNIIATEKSGYYATGVPTVTVTQTTSGTLAVTVTTTTPPGTALNYTSYILGANAFDYCDCGAKIPYETHREPQLNGGEDFLITRQRKLFAPKGFSFVQPSPAILSPTNAQLETTARWEVVKDATGNEYYNSKAIPFARIISRG